MVSKPTHVRQLASGEAISTVTCGDSTCVVQSTSGKLYGWGRGFSQERGIDVSRSRPSIIERIEKRHCFLVSAENEYEQENEQLGNVQVDLPKTYTKAVEVVDLELI